MVAHENRTLNPFKEFITNSTPASALFSGGRVKFEEFTGGRRAPFLEPPPPSLPKCHIQFSDIKAQESPKILNGISSVSGGR
ncbi:hypothetical protein CEXT_264361 [Caerostris extrusa]|uniref:Uncharacterized protein n=1 Tax=Caerostris extrusa TaxID=172846 RepID=A0AAV4P4K1_CAEEX|nr:hypothetical protein CEXT_264361 [Caerostris extrusa]